MPSGVQWLFLSLSLWFTLGNLGRPYILMEIEPALPTSKKTTLYLVFLQSLIYFLTIQLPFCKCNPLYKSRWITAHWILFLFFRDFTKLSGIRYQLFGLLLTWWSGEFIWKITPIRHVYCLPPSQWQDWSPLCLRISPWERGICLVWFSR